MLDEIKSIQAQREASESVTLSNMRQDWLHSEILMAEGSLDRAIEIFKGIVYPPIPTLRIDPILIYNMPFINDLLARAYYESGRLDEAIAEYERKIYFDPQSDNRRLIHPKHRYLLAKLYEEKGEVAKAIEQYEAFLDLWKDADPDLPEPHDARKRLAEL
jgi:tetratricopeptide (TPR) repeat protein